MSDSKFTQPVKRHISASLGASRVSIEQLITEHLDIWTAADTEKKSGRGRGSANWVSLNKRY